MLPHLKTDETKIYLNSRIYEMHEKISVYTYTIDVPKIFNETILTADYINEEQCHNCSGFFTFIQDSYIHTSVWNPYNIRSHSRLKRRTKRTRQTKQLRSDTFNTTQTPHRPITLQENWWKPLQNTESLHQQTHYNLPALNSRNWQRIYLSS